jgi:transcriptional regulator with XRE-family HTH domain
VLVERRTARHIGAMKKPQIDPKSASAMDKHIGARIREARLAMNASQILVGEAVGVTYQQMQKYEAGTNRVSAARLFLMCQFLQVPMSFMFEGIGSNKGSAATINSQKQEDLLPVAQ